MEALAEPSHRLVTLIGPGGIGKTTLAIETARRFAEKHARDVRFVALDTVQSADGLPAGIADALEVPQRGGADRRIHLLGYLREKEILVVLDNIEHLLDGTDLLAEMLDSAPELRLLVTSREALNVRGEWRFEVRSLKVPVAEGAVDASSYSAVQLFVQRAQQARHDFSLARERGDVARICRLVEGMPLALELAASWTNALPCAEIADEIARNLDFLSSAQRDLPDRHRSMLAVFEQSWNRLSDDERDVFKKLSVFRGGFQREGAERVAGATLSILAALVDKSLVQRSVEGRLHLHELLRHYGEEKLAEDEARRMRADHCAYYADFLESHTADMMGGRQLEATEEIDSELDNIMAAWQWAVDHEGIAQIRGATCAFSTFHQFRGRYVQGLRALSQAAEMLHEGDHTPQRSATLALVLVELAWLAIRLGKIEQARDALMECRNIYKDLGSPPIPVQSTDPRVGLGVIALIDGDYAAAERLGREALERGEEHAHPWNQELSLYILTRASFVQGRYGDAREYGVRAHSIAQDKGDRWFLAYCLSELANVASALGDDASAKEHYGASYDIRHEFGDPEGMAVALNHLADLAVKRGDYEEAADRFRRSLVIYREINDRGGLATSLQGLGDAARAAGEIRQGARYYREALRTARSIGFVPRLLSILASVGELLVRAGRREAGTGTLLLARDHASSDDQTAARARDALARCEVESPRADQPVEALQKKPLELEKVAELAEAALIAIEAQSQTRDEYEPFVEPLTEREREVLERIARGMSNPEIAAELVVSIGTVKAHTHNIYGKLGVANRVQALSRARELGVLPPA